MRFLSALLAIGVLFACHKSERQRYVANRSDTVAAEANAQPHAGEVTDLQLRYEYDAFGFVNAITASTGEGVVATAKKVDSRAVGTPMVTDVEVEETHLEPASSRVIYRGRIVFRCRTNEPFGVPVGSKAISGEKRRVIFDRWPYAIAP
jgi:hypothetical protein